MLLSFGLIQYMSKYDLAMDASTYIGKEFLYAYVDLALAKCNVNHYHFEEDNFFLIHIQQQ